MASATTKARHWSCAIGQLSHRPLATVPRLTGRPLSSRARLSASCSSSPLGQEGQPEVSRHVPVGNAFWLLDPMQDRYFNVHGRDFIIQRIEAASHIFPKLRQRCLHQRQRGLQYLGQQQQQHAAAASSTMPASAGGSAAIVRLDPLRGAPAPPVLFEGQPAVDITQLLELLDAAPGQLSAAPIQPWEAAGATPDDSWGPVSCSAAVHVPQPADPLAEDVAGQQRVFISASSSPRRTKMVGFTCLRCKARSFRPVNPMAFDEGTLVVQCGHCEVWHKIRDNLGLFHSLAGDLFPRPVALDPEDVPLSLRLPLEPFYWHDERA